MLTSEQLAVADGNDRKIFLEGYVGTGKTSAGVFRLVKLLQSGADGNNILVLVPQRTLAGSYFEAVQNISLPPGGTVDILTMGGIAQRMISLFWPIISHTAGFSTPAAPPVFLTLETAQYYLAKIVYPLISEEGYFDSIHIDTNRILSQIIDNLNKAAATGIPHSRISSRLKSAWVANKKDLSRPRVYDEAQKCADLFRQFCLDNHLIDFSLQLEIFSNFLWKSFLCREYLTNKYHHLIYDNIEEDFPIAHDIIRQWLPSFQSALLVEDKDAGYRSFLGADPVSAYNLRSCFNETISFQTSFSISENMDKFNSAVLGAINRKPLPPAVEFKTAFSYNHIQFFPDMISWIHKEVKHLLLEGYVSPGEIVILSPFLPDALRFSLMNGLGKDGVPCRSNRPSRSLRDEPATRCLLTLSKLAHPQWKFPVTRFDLRVALMQSIDGLDLIRADLLTKIVSSSKDIIGIRLGSFDNINSEMQERITYSIGERFEVIRLWLENYRDDPVMELDIFISRLFSDVLSKPGFGFRTNLDSASAAAMLIESIQKFRSGLGDTHMLNSEGYGREYLEMVDKGVIAAQYLQHHRNPDSADSVLVSPAYSFLISNRTVRYQFWLDIGSFSWWQRISQPLTHPIVLSRKWSEEKVWNDIEEFQNNQETMSRLVSGLIHRCRDHIYLLTSGYNQNGDQELGPLVQAFQKIQRHIHKGVEGEL